MRLIWNGEHFVDPDKYYEQTINGKASTLPAPMIMKPMAEYRSPLGTGTISSRQQRKDDLKRGNCREIDPSEFRPTYINERFAKKHGKPVDHEGAYNEAQRQQKIIADRKAFDG